MVREAPDLMDRRSPPSLLVVTSTYPRWAADTDPGFVHELCRRLARRGFAVDVVAPRAPGAQRKEHLDGVTVYRYPYFLPRLEVLAYDGGILPKLKANPLLYGLLPFFMAGLCVAIARRLRRGRYGAIHAHWIIPQALAACVARGTCAVPVLVTSHGGDLFGLRSAPLKALKSWTLRRCDQVAVVSRFMRDTVLNDYPVDPQRLHVLPMGADLEGRFIPANGTKRVPDRIVFVGRLVEKKGLRYLLEALLAVKRQHPAAQLDVVGDGPLRDELETQSRSLGLEHAVKFHGSLPQSSIPHFFATAAVAVVPSVVDLRGDQEGLGLVTVEAMGCGCPVVASDLPAIRDVVEHEETGLLARPGDSADLARRILQVLDDPEAAREMADAARRIIVERLDWEQVADSYAKLFHAVATP
jgi:glycosyltransferase involved in cell wall biosynthesis